MNSKNDINNLNGGLGGGGGGTSLGVHQQHSNQNNHSHHHSHHHNHHHHSHNSHHSSSNSAANTGSGNGGHHLISNNSHHHQNGNGLNLNGSNGHTANSKLFNLNNGISTNNSSSAPNAIASTVNNLNLTQQQIMMQSPSVNMAAISQYGQQAALTEIRNSNSSASTNNLIQNQNGQNQQQQQNNNSNTYEDSIMNMNLKQIQMIPWFEVEIKGMVKNLSPKLWQWTHLRCLYLNDNNLMRLPPVVSSLINLQCLDASNNKIRTLPAEIGDMTSLRELYLNHNQLRVLPFELGKLFKLQQLGLKGNPLTSDIMQIYSEPNGSQKLLIHLLDQLTITCPPPPRRPWVILAEPNPTQNPCLFTTMCYNVLCDKYATRQYYGYCPAWALTWDYRKKLILDDIKNFNADIIALQELETEQFYQFFLPELKQYDYDGIFSPKSRAKSMGEQDKKHVDGCAIFFKTSRFQLVKDYLVEFNQIAMATAEGSEDMLNRVMTKDNIGLAALLEVKLDDSQNANNNGVSVNNNGDNLSKSPNSNKDHNTQLSNSSNGLNSNGTTNSYKQMLLVCTAHIHWDPDYCDVKLVQTLMFTNEIKKIIEQAVQEFKPNQIIGSGASTPSSSSTSSTPTPPSNSTNSNQVLNDIPVVICADLNSLPDSGVIEYLRSGKILANHIDFKDLGYDSCLQKINTSEKPSELSHNLRFDCAYDKDIMPYTNYTYDFKGMIDYIFFSRQLMRTVGLLGPLDVDWIKSNRIVGFPHPHVPSDHLPLMVELELFNPNHNQNNNNNLYNGSNNNSLQQQQQQQQNFNFSSNNLNLRPNNQHQHHQQQQHHHSNGNGNSNQLPIGQMIPINNNGQQQNSNNGLSGNFNFNFPHSNNNMRK